MTQWSLDGPFECLECRCRQPANICPVLAGANGSVAPQLEIELVAVSRHRGQLAIDRVERLGLRLRQRLVHLTSHDCRRSGVVGCELVALHRVCWKELLLR